MEIKSYNLFLDIAFDDLKYKGKLAMELETEKDLTLDSIGHEILGMTASGKPVAFERKGEELLVKTGAFKGTLFIQYEGAIPDILAGIYRAPYEDSHFITTQFEAAAARRMFPCVDNPGYKAEFKLSVRVDRDLPVISNMPAESTERSGPAVVVSFRKTPRMSTYLLYLGIGRFEELKDKLGSVHVAIAAAEGKAKEGEYALDAAKKAVASYEKYFEIPYMLPKLHLIAVPEFSAGAMENWGAITFRETALLVRKDSSFRTKKYVAEVVAHELAHQWFGDLVTMKWWNDLWLNESFATFMAAKVTSDLHPDWHVWDEFVNGDTSGALSRDSLKSTHPIQVTIGSPAEVEQIFDEISYGKGASILRMVDAYMGAEQFRKGVVAYLLQHMYSNAAGTDLWTALQASSGQPIEKIMSAWVGKPGYPEVVVSAGAGKIRLRQRRFFLSGESQEEVWPVPITMRVDGKLSSMLLEGREASLKGGASSLKLNVDQTGFYRVYYDGLYDLVWKSELSDLDKWGLLSDALAFLISGRMPFDDYRKVLSRYSREEGYLPALEASDQLSFLYSIVPSKVQEMSKKFHAAQLKILEGKKDENSSLLRGVMASRRSRVDDQYARKLGSRFDDFASVEPDMKDAVAVAYARGFGDYEALLKKYRESTSDEEKNRMLVAMMSVKDPSLVALTLGWGLSGEVKRQDVRTMIGAGTANHAARSVEWIWIKANLEKLRKMYEGTATVGRVLQSAIPVLGIGRREEMERFFADYKLPEGGKGIEAGLERLRIYDKFVSSVQGKKRSSTFKRGRR